MVVVNLEIVDDALTINLAEIVSVCDLKSTVAIDVCVCWQCDG